MVSRNAIRFVAAMSPRVLLSLGLVLARFACLLTVEAADWFTPLQREFPISTLKGLIGNSILKYDFHRCFLYCFMYSFPRCFLLFSCISALQTSLNPP